MRAIPLHLAERMNVTSAWTGIDKADWERRIAIERAHEDIDHIAVIVISAERRPPIRKGAYEARRVACRVLPPAVPQTPSSGSHASA